MSSEQTWKPCILVSLSHGLERGRSEKSAFQVSSLDFESPDGKAISYLRKCQMGSIETVVRLISWNAVIREAKKLLAVLEKLHLEDPLAKLFSGTYGNDIAENLGQYHTILEQLTQKLQGHQL